LSRVDAPGSAPGAVAIEGGAIYTGGPRIASAEAASGPRSRARPWRQPVWLPMKVGVSLPLPRLRPVTPHRPEQDPACAGCPQLGLLRALRRYSVDPSGRLGCEPGEAPLLADVTRAEARVRVLAGPVKPDHRLLPAGAAPLRVDPGEFQAVERALGRALAHPGDTLVLAITPCVLAAPRRPPLAVAEARCNRCGACLTLGCPAIEDVGGEALHVDPSTCSGCGACVPLCRAHAIGPALRLVEPAPVGAPPS